jgi:uncharacterized Zn finger protein
MRHVSVRCDQCAVDNELHVEEGVRTTEEVHCSACGTLLGRLGELLKPAAVGVQRRSSTAA